MDIASIAKLNLLHPAIREVAINCYNQAVKQTPANVHPFIIASARTFDESNALYALGRTVVNPDGKSDEQPMGNIVSNARAGQSWHDFALAIDFGLMIDGEQSWNVDENWMLVIKIFEAAGFNSGLYFPSPVDPDHLERKCGQTLGELMAKYVAGDFIPGTKFVNF